MKPWRFHVSAFLLTIAFWLALVVFGKAMGWILNALYGAFGGYGVVTLVVLVASWPVYLFALSVVRRMKEHKP